MLAEDTELDADSRWKEVKGRFSLDSRYRGVHHSNQREELFHQHISSLVEDDEREERKERERRERMEASMRERERQVQATRDVMARELMKERVHHYREEAVQGFAALLADLVKIPDVDWSVARSVLKKDHRWKAADMLDDEEKEKEFYKHVNELSRRKLAQFRTMLDEVPGVSGETSLRG